MIRAQLLYRKAKRKTLEGGEKKNFGSFINNTCVKKHKVTEEGLTCPRDKNRIGKVKKNNFIKKK